MKTGLFAALSASPVPAALNGLLIYLAASGGVAEQNVVEQAHDEICRSGGTPELVRGIAELAQAFGLVTLEDGLYCLTETGSNYANAGGRQGPSRWDMTSERQEILWQTWYQNAGLGIFAILEDALNLIIRGEMNEVANQYRHAIRFLEGLGVITLVQNKVYFTPRAGELIRRLSLAKTQAALYVASAMGNMANSGSEATCFEHVENERRWLEDCAHRLKAAGFHTDLIEVANLYICAKSSYLTVLAGPPGSGKSSLVRRLAEALGHRSTLLEVAVRRGWSDDHALTGAVNRLHQRFDPAPTGVTEHILKAVAEPERLYWLLLDEFNLSTPEYYFAEFISALESDNPRLTLYQALEGLTNASTYPAQVPIKPNVHIFGTVNLDETSQPLSPRLVDRANFVWVERQIGLEVLEYASMPLQKVGPASALQIDAWRLPAQIEGAERKVLVELITLLGQKDQAMGPAHTVSPRAILAVARYVANSAGVLEPRVALDLAVAQRILPGLRGYGEAYRKRLERVRDLLHSQHMPRSGAMMDRVLATGLERGHEYDLIVSLW